MQFTPKEIEIDEVEKVIEEEVNIDNVHHIHVWESVADHENSYIDSRFQKAAGPVGAYVINGPVEPFYDTIKQHNINNA